MSLAPGMWQSKFCLETDLGRGADPEGKTTGLPVFLQEVFGTRCRQRQYNNRGGHALELPEAVDCEVEDGHCVNEVNKDCARETSTDFGQSEFDNSGAGVEWRTGIPGAGRAVSAVSAVSMDKH